MDNGSDGVEVHVSKLWWNSPAGQAERAKRQREDDSGNTPMKRLKRELSIL
jgi:hypothetical protein